MPRYKQLKEFTGKALKKNHKNNIIYHLFFDKNAKLYIKMIENEGNGTFSKGYFLASKSIFDKQIKDKKGKSKLMCYTEDGTEKLAKDNNTKGFIKAIFKDLNIDVK